MTIAPGIDLPDSALADISRRYEIKELMLFGSAARGEMRPESDVDLLVEFFPDAKIGLFEHFRAEREFSELLGKKVNLVSKRGLREVVRPRVLKDARLIYAA